jgi:hypothetical protein
MNDDFFSTADIGLVTFAFLGFGVVKVKFLVEFLASVEFVMF